MSVEARQLTETDAINEVPTTVDCPCGDGVAERRSTPIIEPAGRQSTAKKVTFSYKHVGCYIGGHIVITADNVQRRYGPLFYPHRYSDRAFKLDSNIIPLTEPAFDLDEHRITDESVGQEIVRFAENHTNPAAARYFGIPQHVVEYHRYKDPVYNNDTTITSSLCNLMRQLAASGHFYSEIANAICCSRSTVMNHVSSTAGAGCSHDVEAARVDMEDAAKKVDAELCKELRRRVADGESCGDLAEEFDIGKRTVNRHVSSSIKASWKCKHNTVSRVNLIERRNR